MRPTGSLHLGHYFGVIRNWLELENQKQCYFFIADWHALTTEYASQRSLDQLCINMLSDWLALGVDHKKNTLFIQSQVPQHAELHLMLSMVTPLGWLERVPSYKELKTQLKGKDLATYGFLGYPLLQAADIALYRATEVPVGEDQLAHVELSREIIRRANHHLNFDLPEPKALLTKKAKLLGLDGRKMSKSYQNCIYFSDDQATLQKKIKNCVTDPNRVRLKDPGDPQKCTAFSYHELFTPQDTINEIKEACQTAQIGCVDCKKTLAKHLDQWIAPIRKKRSEYQKKPDELKEILHQGQQKAKKIAQQNRDELLKKARFLV